MRRILDNISETIIVNTLNKLIITPDDLVNLLKKLEISEDKEKLTNYTFFIVDEDISINDDLSKIDETIEITEIIDNNEKVFQKEPYKILYNDYLKGNINIKIKKLIDYIPNVFVGKEGKTSYKNIDNLNDEISKIFPNELSSFLLNILPMGAPLCKEFININNTSANIFKSPFIEVYSSLLNYTKNEIENSEGLKLILGNIYSNNKENWDEYHKYFQKFLEDLKKRTINY